MYSVGVPKVWSSGCENFTFCPCQLPKKKVLLLTTGPPASNPYWCSFISGFGAPSALAKNSFELSAVLRKNSYAVPWNWFVPPRVATETEAPLLRPSSGVALFVVTLYS